LGEISHVDASFDSTEENPTGSANGTGYWEDEVAVLDGVTNLRFHFLILQASKPLAAAEINRSLPGWHRRDYVAGAIRYIDRPYSRKAPRIALELLSSSPRPFARLLIPSLSIFLTRDSSTPSTACRELTATWSMAWEVAETIVSASASTSE
jgi:hypothetical protein